MDCRIKSGNDGPQISLKVRLPCSQQKSAAKCGARLFVIVASGGRAVIKADFVDQLAGGLAVLGNVGE